MEGEFEAGGWGAGWELLARVAFTIFKLFLHTPKHRLSTFRPMWIGLTQDPLLQFLREVSCLLYHPGIGGVSLDGIKRLQTKVGSRTNKNSTNQGIKS